MDMTDQGTEPHDSSFFHHLDVRATLHLMKAQVYFISPNAALDYKKVEVGGSDFLSYTAPPPISLRMLSLI